MPDAAHLTQGSRDHVVVHAAKDAGEPTICGVKGPFTNIRAYVSCVRCKAEIERRLEARKVRR